MAEWSRNEENRDSNPITESKILPGVPRGQSNGCYGNGQPPLVGLMNGELGGHHPGNDVGSGNGHSNNILGNHGDEGSSSSSSSDEGEGSTESSSEEEGELSEEVQLKRAGVDIDLQSLGAATEGGVAPLPLMSEFVSCCMRDEYGAALILCNKVLEFEPENQTAKDFLPVLQERLKLDEELSTESSTDSEGESGNSSVEEVEAVACGNHTHSHHDC